MKRWLVALISLLALTLSLALGYYLPGGIVALTNDQLSDRVWEYQVQELELEEHPLTFSDTLTLADKLELMCFSPFSQAYLPQGQLMDMEQVNRIVMELLYALFETEIFLNTIDLQPCVAFFSEKQSFVVWSVYLEFQDAWAMQLYLDDTTGAVLMLFLGSHEMAFEEIMPSIFDGSYDSSSWAERFIFETIPSTFEGSYNGVGQNESPSERLADRIITTLEHCNGMTVTAYDPNTGILEVSVDGVSVTSRLFANVGETNVIFNLAYQ